ncbi:MAG: hypothetical protein ACTSV3_07885 [Candidatus Thorarchaeota archaeon]|nr:MAG: hypothetical protein DRP09_08590 [Candidatus Thorarchaeota archaeon]
MQARHIVITIIIVSFLVGQSSILGSIPVVSAPSEIDGSGPDELDAQPERLTTGASDPHSGTLRPIPVEQAGYISSSNISAQTDTMRNTATNLTIDDGNGWMGSCAEVDVWNLKRLYVANGSFDDGVPGTNEVPDSDYYPLGWSSGGYDSASPPASQSQYASYEKVGGGFITVENQGYGSDPWTHYAGSYVFWNQTVINSPRTSEFTLSFDFIYNHGPISKPGGHPYTGWVEISIWIEDVQKDYIQLDMLDYRGVWYTTGQYNLSLPSVANLNRFDFAIGLNIRQDTTLYSNRDYDNDGADDGAVNAASISVTFDNILFVGQTSPSFDEVQLQFNADGQSVGITGASGVGTASINSSSYWTTSPLEVEITSNTTVSFDYEARLLSHRFVNSSRLPSTEVPGVSYTVELGESPGMTAYSYVGVVTPYEDFYMNFHLPPDWENASVYDPFLHDVTSQCSFTQGLVHIPTELVDRLGWWQVSLDAPNYAKSIVAQVYDSGSSWFTPSRFRPGNTTRVEVEIGTASVVPTISDPVNFTWFEPDSSTWSTSSVSTGVAGVTHSESRGFGSSNTTAGMWHVTVVWTNGTCVAYDGASFDLYHSATITADYAEIAADSGQLISNFIRFQDSDTLEYLTDDSTTIVANWSGSTVTFTADPVKNRYEADFDTSLVEGGVYVVIVTASRPYFVVATTEFTITTTMMTVMDLSNAGAIPVEVGLNEVFTVDFAYELTSGVGISGADYELSYTGPVSNGLTTGAFVDHNDGNYSLGILCNTSGTYSITLTMYKAYHHNATDSFNLIIGVTGTSLTLLNGTADLVLFGDDYRLVVQYTNSTGYGLIGATLVVEALTPESGLSHTNFTPLTDGYYEITLTPDSAGTFSLVMSASIINHETQYATFTITASGIPTVLTSLPSSATIAADQNFTLQLRIQDDGFNPIDTANITIIDAPTGLIISEFIPIGNGYYNVTLVPLGIDAFDLLFRATATNYQSSTAAFSLLVTEIQTALDFEGGMTSDSVPFHEAFELRVYYLRSDLGTFIPGANLSVVLSDSEAISVNIQESGEYYLVTLTGNRIGTLSVTVVANLSDYRVATRLFLLEVVEVETHVDGSGPLDAIFVDRTYYYNFSFLYGPNASIVVGASVLPSGEGASWITYDEIPSGLYSIRLVPGDIGDFSVVLSFEKYGYRIATFRLNFRVVRIPLTVIVNQGLDGFEGTATDLIVTILEQDTGEPVSGLTVTCRLVQEGLPLESYEMTETETPGIYSARLMMPDADSVYSLRIEVDGAHHELASAYQDLLTPQRTLVTMVTVTLQRYYILFVGTGVVIAGLAYRKKQRKRRIRENLEALAIKRRFDAVRNLLGVIVLHKDSGLPIYSKILREGLDEAVISAFITAITSFRSEFDIEDSSEEWSLVPISDIVRVIATDKLYCAFITVSRPTEEQRERMIRFAKTVAFIFDDQLGDVPIAVLDQHNKRQFESLFDDILDGALLKTYTLAEDKKYKPSSCADERISRRRGLKFSLDELASDIASCGLEEGRVYKAIMDAINKQLLVQTEADAMAEMDASDPS